MTTRPSICLTDVERDELRTLFRLPRTPRALADRCKVVLLDDEGLTYAANHALQIQPKNTNAEAISPRRSSFTVGSRQLATVLQ